MHGRNSPIFLLVLSCHRYFTPVAAVGQKATLTTGTTRSQPLSKKVHQGVFDFIRIGLVSLTQAELRVISHKMSMS